MLERGTDGKGILVQKHGQWKPLYILSGGMPQQSAPRGL